LVWDETVFGEDAMESKVSRRVENLIS
jgi:hypothetical protein